MLSQNFQQHSLGNFSVIWLDPNINESNEDYQYSIRQLRQVVNTIKTFVNIDDGIDCLTDVKDRTFLMIVSDDLGKQLISAIQEIPHLCGIYVLCTNESINTDWSKDYQKIKGVFTQIQPLCDHLKLYVNRTNMNLASFSIIPPSSALDLNQLDQSFMYSQLLKEILLRRKYTEKDKTEFIEFCLIQYVENETALQLIDKFEREYDGLSPIRWYTRDCFISSMLNNSLRTQDIEIILKMSFFIRDLHQQIENLHFNSNNRSALTVYRGQGMSNVEFEKLSQSKGGLLAFNSFLSTSFDRNIAFTWAYSAQDNLELTGVLFQLEIDPFNSTTPFAILDRASYFSDLEQEILFSMHTVFRISEINKIENRIWEVKLKSTSDSDEKLKCLTDCMRKEIGDGTEWNQLGRLMVKMGEYDKAEKIINVIRESIPDDDWINIASFHNDMGAIMAQKGENQTALSHYEKALMIRQKFLPRNHFYFATLHNNIGEVNRSIEKYSTALSHFEKALEIRQKYLSSDHPDLATTYNSIGLTYQSMEKSSTALQYLEKALKIWQKSLPPNHPDIALLHNNIGSLYQTIGGYPTALQYFEKALEMRQKSLPPNHPDLGTSHNNIGSIYLTMNNNKTALSHFKKAIEILEKSLSPNHLELVEPHNNAGLAFEAMGEYTTALSHHKKALEIREKSLPLNYLAIARSFNNIGSVYHSMEEISIALSYYNKALENFDKCPSYGGATLALLHNNIGELYRSMKDFSTALSHYKQAQEIQQVCLSLDHPDVALVFNNIGLIHQSMTEYSTALLCFEKALEIWQKSLPRNHSNLLELHNSLSITYQSLHRYEDARHHAFKAMGIDFRAFNLFPSKQQIFEDELD